MAKHDSSISDLNTAGIFLALLNIVILGVVGYFALPSLTCAGVDCGLGVLFLWPFLLLVQVLVIVDGIVILRKRRTGTAGKLLTVLGVVLVTSPVWYLVPIALSWIGIWSRG
jgi:hypothetical protein